MSNSPIATAIGSGLAVGGGLVAQTPNANVGTVGAIVAIGGLVTAILGGIGQLLKSYYEAKNYDTRLKEMKDQLDASRERRHQEANRFNAILMELQAKQVGAEARAADAERKATDAAIRAARLEGQFGLTARLQGQAINVNAENIGAVANQTGTTLPQPSPHVDPAPPPPAPPLVLPLIPEGSDDTFPIAR